MKWNDVHTSCPPLRTLVGFVQGTNHNLGDLPEGLNVLWNEKSMHFNVGLNNTGPSDEKTEPLFMRQPHTQMRAGDISHSFRF